jgi:DNA-directed RNA polymerase subunit RPC12/RpoP
MIKFIDDFIEVKVSDDEDPLEPAWNMCLECDTIVCKDSAKDQARVKCPKCRQRYRVVAYSKGRKELWSDE